MVVGVSEQFDLTLTLKGVGYRATVQGEEIVLSLGYSHPVKMNIPKEISVEVVQNTTINLKSCDKALYLQQIFVLGDNLNRIKEKNFI
jgi:large subunit ribosomal protein L6